MKPYIEWTKEELVAEKARLEQEFAEVKANRLPELRRTDRYSGSKKTDRRYL